jgi:hypothetical protein
MLKSGNGAFGSRSHKYIPALLFLVLSILYKELKGTIIVIIFFF